MHLLLLICLCLLSSEMATAADAEAAKTVTPAAIAEATTPESTIEPGTSPPLMRSTKSSQEVPKLLENTYCSGWCLHKVKPSRVMNITVNKTLDDILLKTIYLIKALVENTDNYPVRVDANLFADKNQYFDRETTKARSPIFSKNVIKVPTTLFFPYTRSAIKKAILESGTIYIPNQDRKFRATKTLPTRDDNTPFAFLWNQPVFANSYFQSKPLLHTDMKVSPNRKTRTVAKRMSHSADPYNIGNKRRSFDYAADRRSIPIELKTSKLGEFVYSGHNKQRAKAQMAPSEVTQMLGVPLEETMLEPAHNTVDDIIAGMKIKGKDTGTFIIGATKNGRSKIMNWIGQKSRAGKVSNAPDTGVILKGKSRARAMDSLLRSMVRNFQFGDNMPTYKKLTPVTS